jgi:hypothetical protein
MKRLLITIVCLLSFILGACTVTTVGAAQTFPLKIWKQNENGCMTTFNIVDESTGVNYVVVTAKSQGHCTTVAIAPRYNPDGTLYVTP